MSSTHVSYALNSLVCPKCDYSYPYAPCYTVVCPYCEYPRYMKNVQREDQPTRELAITELSADWLRQERQDLLVAGINTREARLRLEAIEEELAIRGERL